jgi:hypothetical protein
VKWSGRDKLGQIKLSSMGIQLPYFRAYEIFKNIQCSMGIHKWQLLFYSDEGRRVDKCCNCHNRRYQAWPWKSENCSMAKFDASESFVALPIEKVPPSNEFISDTMEVELSIAATL